MMALGRIKNPNVHLHFFLHSKAMQISESEANKDGGTGCGNMGDHFNRCLSRSKGIGKESGSPLNK